EALGQPGRDRVLAGIDRKIGPCPFDTKAVAAVQLRARIADGALATRKDETAAHDGFGSAREHVVDRGNARRQSAPDVREELLAPFSGQRAGCLEDDSVALGQEPGRIPGDVEIAAVVVLDVAEGADGDERARDVEVVASPHENAEAIAVRPRVRRDEAGGAVDLESSSP